MRFERIGSYDVTALIGQGRMGEVYRAIAAGVLLVVLAAASAQAVQDGWEAADRAIERLAPAEIPGLPEGVRSFLEGLGCTIPVPAWSDGLTSVVRGEYRQAGQTDWAVLCSMDRVSRILVFWSGDPVHVAVLGERSDRDYLQRDESGRPVFSRSIATVEGRTLIPLFARSGLLPGTPHAGIEDAFLGKGSTFHYYFDERWVTLPTDWTAIPIPPPPPIMRPSRLRSAQPMALEIGSRLGHYCDCDPAGQDRHPGLRPGAVSRRFQRR